MTKALKAGSTTLLVIATLVATALIMGAVVGLGKGRWVRPEYPQPGTVDLPGQPVGESAPSIVQP